MDDIFRVTKDASGNPIYMHNNEALSKEIFDQRNKDSEARIQEMRTSTTAGIDDDPDIIAMKEKVKAMSASKKTVKKAGGGSINLSRCKVTTAQKNSSSSRW